MMADIFCPIHKDISQKIDSIVAIQGTRHCGSHDAMIKGLNEDMDRVEVDNKDQWTAINSLRRLVYMGAGGVAAAAFFGSVLGNVIAGLLKKGMSP
jgi:hypothetical protein